jgi:hypothetical protein
LDGHPHTVTKGFGSVPDKYLPVITAKKSRFLASGRGVRRTPGIGTEEQIAEGATKEVCDPALRQVMRTVVDHVTALA